MEKRTQRVICVALYPFLISVYWSISSNVTCFKVILQGWYCKIGRQRARDTNDLALDPHPPSPTPPGKGPWGMNRFPESEFCTVQVSDQF